MTSGQRESIHMIYVHTCNAYFYAENLCLEESLSKPAKDSIRVIRDRLNWIKKSIDMKINQDMSKLTDTMRYDAIMRMMCNLPEEYQDKFESMVIQFLESIE